MPYQLIDEKFPVFGVVDDGAIRQMRNCFKDERLVRGAIMADGHIGYGVQIGGVVAYRDAISPSAVGFDISCGNLAVRTDAHVEDVRRNISTIMHDIAKNVSFGIGRVNSEPVDHELFDDATWKMKPYAAFKELARRQLGTVGSGNHYVDIFADENEAVWIGVHFGSRGFGHKTASHFLALGGAKDGMDADPLVLPAREPMGEDYLAGMHLASRYAYAGREWVCGRVARILGARMLQSIHNNHNLAWEEEHGGEKLWVIRKGATPNRPGQLSFVGGSMGENSYIFRGVDSEEAKATLYSTIHGAGRAMGRMEAKGKRKKIKDAQGRDTWQITREPKVTAAMMDAWLASKQIVRVGGDVDESPHCYKRIDEVKAFHAASIEVVHTLHPLGVCMAGDDIVDPYKD